MAKYEIKYEIGNLKNDNTIYSYIVNASDENDAKDKFFKEVFKDKKLQNKILFLDNVVKLDDCK